MLTQKISSSSAFISTWRKGTRCKLLLGTTEMLQCSFHWGCSGRAAGGAQELLQGWLAHSFYKPTCGRASSRADRQTTPSCFQGKPLFCFQSHSHMLSFLFLVLYAHSSHDDTLQLITTTTGSLLLSLVNQWYLPKRKDVWQLFLSVLWHQLLHCTMNHCYHLSHRASTPLQFWDETRTRSELQCLKHLTPIERMTHQNRTVYKTEVAFVRNVLNTLVICFFYV